MNKQKKYLLYSGVTVALALAAAAVIPGASVRAAAAPEETSPSALVSLQTVQMKPMHASLVAYGEVFPGSLQTISSAVPAQLSRLAVMQGQSVRKGELLAQLERDPGVALAYAQARTAHELARAEWQRVQSMAQLQLATQSQIDIASKALADASAGLAAQVALGGAAGQTLRAPADGMIVALNVLQGERLQAGVPILQFGATDQLKLVLGIDPGERASVRIGAVVRLTALSGSGRTVSASVAAVQDMLDAKTQLINVVVKLPNGGDFVPGVRVRGEIELATRNAYEVPRQAVLRDAAGSYVYQQVGQHAHRVAVTQVTDGQRNVGVTGTIDPARPIVVTGNYELQEGMLLREKH
jgi:membrane fusion protein (multidrug efflux system)